MSGSEEKGQVSQVGGFGDDGGEIQPDQSVHGAPDGESGEVQEGTAGPNARVHDNRPEKGEESKRDKAYDEQGPQARGDDEEPEGGDGADPTAADIAGD